MIYILATVFFGLMTVFLFMEYYTTKEKTLEFTLIGSVVYFFLAVMSAFAGVAAYYS